MARKFYVILLTKCIKVKGQPLPELQMSKRAWKMGSHYQLKCELKEKKAAEEGQAWLETGIR